MPVGEDSCLKTEGGECSFPLEVASSSGVSISLRRVGPEGKGDWRIRKREDILWLGAKFGSRGSQTFQ